MTGDEATHSEWPVVHMVGTGEHWDSCVALPGTFLLQLALLLLWRVLYKTGAQQPAPPCWGSSQNTGLAG